MHILSFIFVPVSSALIQATTRVKTFAFDFWSKVQLQLICCYAQFISRLLPHSLLFRFGPEFSSLLPTKGNSACSMTTEIHPTRNTRATPSAVINNEIKNGKDERSGAGLLSVQITQLIAPTKKECLYPLQLAPGNQYLRLQSKLFI